MIPSLSLSTAHRRAIQQVSSMQRHSKHPRVTSSTQRSFPPLRQLATHTEPQSSVDYSDEIYEFVTPDPGYTSRHVLSIFPPTPVLDKMQEIQAKLQNRTRILPIPRANLHVVLVPLGTSLADPGKLSETKMIMDRVARQTKPIAIEIGPLGCIPKWNKPREVFAGLTGGKEDLKTLIKLLEQEFQQAQFVINEPGAVKHRTRIPLGVWEDVYVTSLQGDLAKEVADSVGLYTQASFMANQMVLLEQQSDSTLVPIHVSQFGTTLPAKGRARYKTLL